MGKQKKTKVISTRVDIDFHKQIENYAALENRNISNMAETLLKEAVLNRANKSK